MTGAPQDTPVLCPCGQPLHYTDEHLESVVCDLIIRLGPDVPVIAPSRDIGNRAWMVPRHYIALHGLRGTDLATVAERLGFKELFICPRCLRLSHNPNDFIHRYCGHCHESFPESFPAPPSPPREDTPPR